MRAAFLAALAAFAGCRDRPADGPMPMPTRAPPEGHVIDTAVRYTPDGGVRDTQKPAPKRTEPLGEAELEAIAALAPRVGRVAVPLEPVPRSRIARSVLCLRAKSPSDGARMLEKALADKGWGELDTAMSSRDTSRAVVTGERRTRRVTATLQTESARCRAGELQASVSYQELGRRAPGVRNGASPALKLRRGPEKTAP